MLSSLLVALNDIILFYTINRLPMVKDWLIGRSIRKDKWGDKYLSSPHYIKNDF